MSPVGYAQVPGADRSPAPAPRGLPSLGDAGDMTPLEERKLGDAIAREIYRDPDYLDDPIIGEYVDGLWRQLIVGARARGELPDELLERYAWRVLLGRDRTINAFALPGGYFGLHTGLVGVVTSRDELASVLAHEMTHITQRHIPRMLGKEGRETPLMLAALLLGALAGARNPQAGAALMMGGQAAIIQRQINFTREMEREADRVGYGIMTQAGYAPEGFVTMFEKLQVASRINDNGDWPYLRSHPLTSQRIGDMQQRQQNLRHGATASSGAAAAASAPSAGEAGQRGGPPDLEALMMAGRARVLGRPGVDVLRSWAAEPEKSGFAQQPLARRVGALYAAAVSEAELRDLPRAQALATQLALAVSGDVRGARQARLLQAELALRANQPARALEWLPPEPSARSGMTAGRAGGRGDAALGPPSEAGRALLLMRAQALTRTGQGAQAASDLQAWVGEHPSDAGAWQILGQAYAAQGQTLRQLRAEGEVQLAHMDYAGAVDRWRAAQDFSRQQSGGGKGDLIEASIVDARLNTARELLRQQQLDEKKRK